MSTYEESSLSLNSNLVFLGRAVDVPEADGVVVGGGEEVPVQVGVPAQAVALLLVAAQSQVGVALEEQKEGEVRDGCSTQPIASKPAAQMVIIEN